MTEEKAAALEAAIGFFKAAGFTFDKRPASLPLRLKEQGLIMK